MTQPTRQEIIDAHAALESLCDRLYGTRYAKLAILKALPPKPNPTMAEVEWDDDKHFLAEAVTIPSEKKVIMVGTQKSDYITVIHINRSYGLDSRHDVFPVGKLTPTGRRYTLAEVQDD